MNTVFTMATMMLSVYFMKSHRPSMYPKKPAARSLNTSTKPSSSLSKSISDSVLRPDLTLVSWPTRTSVRMSLKRSSIPSTSASAMLLYSTDITSHGTRITGSGNAFAKNSTVGYMPHSYVMSTPVIISS